MKKFFTYLLVITLVTSAHAVSLENLGEKIGRMSDDEMLSMNMKNFFEGLSNGGVNPLSSTAEGFYPISNETISLVLRSLEQSMDDQTGRLLNKPQKQVIADSVRASRSGQSYKGGGSVKGLSSYSRQQSAALLNFIEIFYRNRDKPNMDVKDFLFIFRESGLPFLNQLRSGLGLPPFDVKLCTQIIGSKACTVK